MNQLINLMTYLIKGL